MEKKGVGRPRDGNPEETRQEILRAAAEAFAACGFVGATTRAVAARASVNVATLHYHFGSKEGLYRAVIGNACRGTLPDIPSGTGAETVAGLVGGLFEFGAQRPTLARLALLDRLAGPAGGGEPDERVRWFASTLRPLLTPSNGRPAPDAGEVAQSVVALVDATFVAAPRPVQGLPDEAARAAVVAAALRLSGLV
ncbi:MAG: TetR/AcrR family transcriptional regulator [Holophagales bacterium]|nr:TetR/AcrR family transcriptional regulator [Holophagales bacterium]